MWKACRYCFAVSDSATPIPSCLLGWRCPAFGRGREGGTPPRNLSQYLVIRPRTRCKRRVPRHDRRYTGIWRDIHAIQSRPSPFQRGVCSVGSRATWVLVPREHRDRRVGQYSFGHCRILVGRERSSPRWGRSRRGSRSVATFAQASGGQSSWCDKGSWESWICRPAARQARRHGKRVAHIDHSAAQSGQRDHDGRYRPRRRPFDRTVSRFTLNEIDAASSLTRDADNIGTQTFVDLISAGFSTVLFDIPPARPQANNRANPIAGCRAVKRQAAPEAIQENHDKRQQSRPSAPACAAYRYTTTCSFTPRLCRILMTVS